LKRLFNLEKNIKHKVMVETLMPIW
jgi:hypothetical protein